LRRRTYENKNKQRKEITMEARLDILSNDMAMKVVKHLVSANKVVADSLSPSTAELVKIRASQINGCVASASTCTRKMPHTRASPPYG
jgi:alkylhydroperoxidase family enzyme